MPSAGMSSHPRYRVYLTPLLPYFISDHLHAPIGRRNIRTASVSSPSHDTRQVCLCRRFYFSMCHGIIRHPAAHGNVEPRACRFIWHGEKHGASASPYLLHTSDCLEAMNPALKRAFPYWHLGLKRYEMPSHGVIAHCPF